MGAFLWLAHTRMNSVQTKLTKMCAVDLQVNQRPQSWWGLIMEQIETGLL